MAINLDERYPGRANPKSLSYPQGSFKNRTSPTSKDGTYLEQDWANDWAGFFQRMMVVSGISPNGAVDTAESSQYFDALSKIISDATPDASTTKKGLMKIATNAEAQALTDDTKALTPKKLADAFGGPNRSLDAYRSWYQIFPGEGGRRLAMQHIFVLVPVPPGGLADGQSVSQDFDYPLSFRADTKGTYDLAMTGTPRGKLLVSFDGSSRYPYGDKATITNVGGLTITQAEVGVHVLVIGEI